jgi:molecular chaperone DnaK (HSP70)
MLLQISLLNGKSTLIVTLPDNFKIMDVEKDTEGDTKLPNYLCLTHQLSAPYGGAAICRVVRRDNNVIINKKFKEFEILLPKRKKLLSEIFDIKQAKIKQNIKKKSNEWLIIRHSY